MKIFRMVYLSSWLLLAVLFCFGCSRKSVSVTKLVPYIVTNRFVGGEFRQLIQITNGMDLYFTSSNIVIGFCPGTTTVIPFDPETRRPSSIFWDFPATSNEPGQSVIDFNADGVPDFRRLEDEQKTRQIFLRGEWYTTEKEGNHIAIDINGKKQKVHFDGRRWAEISTNSDLVTTNN